MTFISSFYTFKAQQKLFLFLLFFTILRVISSFYEPYSLQVDEAQYAGWAHQLSAGYYSKPPFIAWILRLGQETCAVMQWQSVEGCTRMMQAPALLVTCIFIMLASWQLFKDYKVTVVSGLLFISLPLIGFYSLVATTDAWLLMWWSIALFAFILMLKQTNAWWPFIMCGFSVGLGLLAKYAMLLFVFSALLIMIKQKGWIQNKRFLARALVALSIAFLIFLPNIIWNANVDFPTYEHHIAISQLSTSQGHAWTINHAFVELFTFIGSQFFVFGPWAFFTLMLLSLTSEYKTQIPEDVQAIQFLLLFTWPMLGLMLIEAFLSRAFANWAVAAYVSGTILVAAFWVRQSQHSTLSSRLLGEKAIKWSIFIGLIFSFFLIIAPHFIQSSHFIKSSKPVLLQKMQGWKELALWAKFYVKDNPMRVLASDRYLLAELSAYGYPETYPPLAFNVLRLKDNHYRWFYDLESHPVNNQPMLLILTQPANSALLQQLHLMFEKVTIIQDENLSKIQVGKNQHPATAFLVTRFKGYPK